MRIDPANYSGGAAKVRFGPVFGPDGLATGITSSTAGFKLKYTIDGGGLDDCPAGVVSSFAEVLDGAESLGLYTIDVSSLVDPGNDAGKRFQFFLLTDTVDVTPGEPVEVVKFDAVLNEVGSIKSAAIGDGTFDADARRFWGQALCARDVANGRDRWAVRILQDMKPVAFARLTGTPTILVREATSAGTVRLNAKALTRVGSTDDWCVDTTTSGELLRYAYPCTATISAVVDGSAVSIPCDLLPGAPS